MKNHTPGPWLLATSNSWRRIVSRDNGNVCEPITQNDGHPDLFFKNGGEDGPDAALLVRAPELLAALQRIAALSRNIEGRLLKPSWTDGEKEMHRAEIDERARILSTY